MTTKRVSLKQIAERCGFSVPLVSAVLSRNRGANRCSAETYEKIKCCAEEMGYAPNILAKAVATGKSPIILFSLHAPEGVVSDFPNFYMADILINGAHLFAGRGYYALYMPYRDAEEQFRQIMEITGSSIASGIVANIHGNLDPLYAYLMENRIPSVILGFPQTEGLVSVGVDATPLRAFLADYAGKRNFRRWLYLATGEGAMGFSDQETGGDVADAEILAPETYCFLSGIGCFKRFTARYPDFERNRIVLLEDSRFQPYPGQRTILFPSANPAMMEKACGILVKWCRDGVAPERKAHVVEKSLDNVQIFEPK